MASPKPEPPTNGARITIQGGKLSVPDHPILPFIEGDGTGPDIWRASVRVLDAAVKKAYGGKREIQWMEVYAGEKAYKHFSTWLPDETVTAFRDYLVGVKLSYLRVAGERGKVWRVFEALDVNAKVDLIGYEALTPHPPNEARTDGFIDALVLQLGLSLRW